MANVCDSFCNGCVYSTKEGGYRCCNYIFAEDKRRPCPAGKGCTVKKTGKHKDEAEKKRYELAQKEKKNKKLQEYRKRAKATRRRKMECDWCGVVFETTDSRRKFCCNECYNKARSNMWAEREKERNRVKKRISQTAV